MSYYNRDCKRLSINKKNMDYLKMGGCANIWHDSNIVFKEYFCDTVPVLRLSCEMFDFLKTINDPHFIELYDIYSKMSLLKLFKYKRDSQFFTVDAYTAKYYPDNSVNVLTAPVDYILDNFRELDILFDVFTKHQVVTCDIKRENSILSHDGIVIIDPDLFAKTERHQDDYIATANKQNLLNFFHSILFNAMQSLFSVNEKLFVNQKINSIIEDITVKKNTDIAYQLSKKIGHVKRPIDYLRE